MLCPICGTEVGEQLALCPKCAAARAAAHSGGAALGAIRPNIKVVRLNKPIEKAPEDSAESTPESPPSEDEHTTAEMPPEYTRRIEPRPQAEDILRDTRQTEPRVAPNILFLGFLLILLAAWLTVWVIKPKSVALVEEVQPKVPTQLVQAVLNKPKEVVVDGQNVLGAYRINNVAVPLDRVTARFNAQKNFLELFYYTKERVYFPEVPSNPDLNKPLLRVVLQFAPLTQKLDRDKLQSYLLEYLGSDKPLRVVNSYSAQLAAFGEVAIAGTIKAGEPLHVGLNNSRELQIEGKTLSIAWNLLCDTPLVIEPASK